MSISLEQDIQRLTEQKTSLEQLITPVIQETKLGNCKVENEKWVGKFIKHKNKDNNFKKIVSIDDLSCTIQPFCSVYECSIKRYVPSVNNKMYPPMDPYSISHLDLQTWFVPYYGPISGGNEDA